MKSVKFFENQLQNSDILMLIYVDRKFWEDYRKKWLKNRFCKLEVKNDIFSIKY
jgi:hypothetical protein